ncbi:gag-pol polyprotein [Tanacetum coccineum]
MSIQQDINAFRTQRLANTHDPLALMANTQTPFHPDQSSHITYIQHPQPNNHFVQKPSFNMNYMQQPMQNLEDSSDHTTAMNMALALIAKAFKVNTIPTNNNQRSSLIPRNSQIAQLGMNTSQDIKMQMVDDNVGKQMRHNAVQNDGNEGLSVVLEIANQYGNGNVKTTPAKGNGNGINGNPIRLLSDIGIQEKKAKLFNEWERFTSIDGESIESYYHHKAFKLNYSTPINNNQRISSNPQNRQIAQPGNQVVQNAVQNPGAQNVGNQNGLIVVPRIANQNGNGNVVAPQAEGNANTNNGNQIRCYNCIGLGHLARKCIVRPRRGDVAYLQTQLLIAQNEEAGIQLHAEEFDLMDVAADLDEIEEVNANCILMDNLQQASTSGTQSDKAPVYDSDGSAEVSSVKQGGGTVEQHSATVKETRVYHESLFHNLADNVEKVNTVNRKMKETNAELTTELARYKNQEKSVTTFQSLVLPKVDKMNALSKLVTSNSAPSTQESKVMQTVNVIAPRLFRTNPSKTSRVFAITALKSNLRKLKENSVDTKFAKTSVLGKPVSQSLRNQSVVRQPNAFKFERPQMSKPRFASQVDVNHNLSRPVTQHYLPKISESAFSKPNHMIASSSSRNSSKNLPRFSSNDMVHNHYLDEARKKTQERDRNSKTSVMPSARFQSTADDSKPKPRSTNHSSRSLPVSKSSCVTKTAVPIADHSKNSNSFSDSKHFVCSTCHKCVFNANHDACITNFLKEVNSRAKIQSNKTRNSNKPKTSPRSDLRWKPTGRIFNTVGLRWVPTGKILASCTSNDDSEPTYGSNVDIPNIHECKQTPDLSVGTSINVQKEQSFDFSAVNGENQVVSKSSAVTAVDASDKRQ